MNNFKNCKVLITGGLGFIGSNLAIKLVNIGADVTIVDSMLSEQGGNMFNIENIKHIVKVNICDITDVNAMEYLVREKDFVFHLAGQGSHILWQTNPYPDIEYNIKGTLILLEACTKYNKEAKIIYTGTRGQYGAVLKLPANEETPQNPKGLYELTNLMAEKIFLLYNEVHNIKSVLTRLTNVYGPRSQMKNNKQGVANWFIRLALDNQDITLYGDGLLKRDFIYIDDVVEALLKVALTENAYGQVFNIGNDKVSDFKELAENIVRIAGKGQIKHIPFSEERKKQEPGDFFPDIEKIKEYTNWKPKIMLKEGIYNTVEYYKKYKEYYW